MSISLTPQFVFSVGLYFLAGYFFSRISYYRRFQLEHLAAHEKSFAIFGYAVLLYFLSWLAHFILRSPDTLASIQAFEREVEIGTRPVISLALAGIIGVADNFRVLVLMLDDPSMNFEKGGLTTRMRMAANARYVRSSDDESLRLLFRAVLLKKLVMVTLNNDKVYVGYVSRYPSNPTRPPTFLRLIPHASGYRDDKKQVHLPVRYDELRSQLESIELEESEASPEPNRDLLTHPLHEDTWTLSLDHETTAAVDLNDFGMVIPWREVSTMTIYNDDIHRAFVRTDEAAWDLSAS